ncbi:MAG: substrate-binding domain-containing protein [Rhodospirillales bacterium]|jgi:putative molybdopterin biosynthesis protein
MQQDATPGAQSVLTSEEAAEFLRLSRRKLFQLVGERRLPVARIDGRLLFPRRALEAWLDAQLEAGPHPEPPPVCAGSHDPLLDWAVRESGCGLALLTQGSGEGLVRLLDGAAAVAGLHLHDPDSGETNGPALVAAGARGFVAIEWARRTQGLLLPAGNPAALGGVADLAGRRVVRRQATAGSQGLLEALMAKAGVAPDAVTWTRPVAHTHSDAAAMVATGAADAAFGVASAARAAGLGFVALHEERFDLVMRRRAYFEPPVQRLLAFARTPALAEKAVALGGYDVGGLGTVRANL